MLYNELKTQLRVLLDTFIEIIEQYWSGKIKENESYLPVHQCNLLFITIQLPLTNQFRNIPQAEAVISYHRQARHLGKMKYLFLQMEST